MDNITRLKTLTSDIEIGKNVNLFSLIMPKSAYYQGKFALISPLAAYYQGKLT